MNFCGSGRGSKSDGHLERSGTNEQEADIFTAGGFFFQKKASQPIFILAQWAKMIHLERVGKYNGTRKEGV